MKKLSILLFISLTFFCLGCNKKHSPSNNIESTKTILKCPNCGSESIKSLEPGGRILECNSCGIAFNK